jgi:hypothetical protein
MLLERENNPDGRTWRATRAATIPRSRTQRFPGSAIAPYFQDAPAIRRVVTEFLAEA